MTRKRFPISLVVIFWLLLPVSVYSQDAQTGAGTAPAGPENLSGSVTLGGAGVSLNRESFKFGEYTGIEDTGGYFVGEADLNYHRDSYYADFFVDNLGLEHRNIYFEVGRLGDYSSFVEYDQQPHLLNNTGTTSFQGVGGTTLTGGSTVGPFRSIDQDTDTDTLHAGIKKTFGANRENDFLVTFRRMEKDGVQDLGATFGFANATILPEPVDQVTNEVRTSLAHNGERAQVKLEYFLSLFENKDQSIFFNNPFVAGNGLISRDPDNTYHKVSLTGGYSLSPTTRITGIAEYGRTRQDEQLLGFSINPAAVVTTPVPRQSADATIQTIHLGMKLATRPFSKLSVGGSYRYYQTINDTPSQLFLYIPNDGTAQNAITAANALFTQPYDYIQNKAGVFAAYRAPLSTTVKLHYDVDWRNRDRRAVEHTVEQTVKSSVRFGHLDFMDVYVHGLYANRRGDKYDPSQVFNDRHTAQFIGTGATFDVFPDLQQLDIANRERVKFGTDLDFFLLSNVGLGLSYSYVDDDYPNATLGFTESMRQTASIDVNFTGKYESYYVYYTYDNADSQQKGRVVNADLNTNWESSLDDITHTVGVGGKLGFMHNRLWVGADYSYSQTISDISFIAAPGAGTVTPVDDIQATLHTVKLHSFYKLDDHIDVGIRYKGQRYDADNFFTDGVNPNTLGTVLFLGGSNPNYYAHIGLLYATYHFGGRN